MANLTPVTVAYGDGIGPEIMAATLQIIEAAGARIQMEKANGDGLQLIMIDNRGVKVWPGGMAEMLCTDSHRSRFESKNGTTQKQTVALLGGVLDQGVDIVKTESLRSYDGKQGYTLAQGQ